MSDRGLAYDEWVEQWIDEMKEHPIYQKKVRDAVAAVTKRHASLPPSWSKQYDMKPVTNNRATLTGVVYSDSSGQFLEVVTHQGFNFHYQFEADFERDWDILTDTPANQTERNIPAADPVYGCTCTKCGEYYEHAEAREGFRCYSCRSFE